MPGVTTFFHAWRQRQALRHATAWDEERTEARALVAEVPPRIRVHVSRLVELLIDGPDEALQGALDQLWSLLESNPGLRQRCFRLRVVEDAVEFLRI